MTQEDISEWLCDGERNSLGIYTDDDFPQKDGFVALSRDENVFHVRVTPPFDVTWTSTPLDVLTRVTAGASATTLFERLDQIARALVVGSSGDDDDGEGFKDDEGEFHDDIDEDYDGGGQDGFNRVPAPLSSQRVIEQQMYLASREFDQETLSQGAMERLLRDLVSMRDGQHFGWKATPIGRSLARWTVELFDFDAGSPLEQDMQRVAAQGGSPRVTLAMTFNKDYPFKPPFLRVIRPRFVFRTARVTVGGSICTQLLTDEGWCPAYDIVALLVEIRALITDPESKARVDFSSKQDYTEQEAIEAFQRVAAEHKRNGW